MMFLCLGKFSLSRPRWILIEYPWARENVHTWRRSALCWVHSASYCLDQFFVGFGLFMGFLGNTKNTGYWSLSLFSALFWQYPWTKWHPFICKMKPLTAVSTHKFRFSLHLLALSVSWFQNPNLCHVEGKYDPQINFYLYSPKSQWHCLNGLYNLYCERQPWIQMRKNLPWWKIKKKTNKKKQNCHINNLLNSIKNRAK